MATEVATPTCIISNQKDMPNSNQENRLIERVRQCEERLDNLGPVEDIICRYDSLREQLKGTKEVLTLEEAADFLGLSKSQIYRLTSTNAIPHYKPSGKYIYFDRAELIEWTKRNPVKTKREHELDAIKYVANKPLTRR